MHRWYHLGWTWNLFDPKNQAQWSQDLRNSQLELQNPAALKNTSMQRSKLRGAVGVRLSVCRHAIPMLPSRIKSNPIECMTLFWGETKERDRNYPTGDQDANLHWVPHLWKRHRRLSSSNRSATVRIAWCDTAKMDCVCTIIAWNARSNFG